MESESRFHVERRQVNTNPEHEIAPGNIEFDGVKYLRIQ